MRQPPDLLRQAGTFASIRALPDASCPIEPGWMRSGTPRTRCNQHSSTLDGFAWTMVWDCTRSTFEWHYTIDEVVVVLEGSVRVTDCHGVSHTLGVGDVGYFPAGSSWFWEVDDYVRKIAFCRDEVPRGLRLPMRVVRRLQREFGSHRNALAVAWRLLVDGCRRVVRLGRATATMMLMSFPL
ncbi:cupin domain-containing protein [Cupriavidus pauculus]|jgi:uncharacterized cupin superfamily protein|uniref:cupin domain-containing protein n=1 Tax=Cupriavidus pauculus TaxID=82633 RepID=UPI001243EFA7|nr:cupin domain-containing protein [Cupriavidus pauculus]KAB0605149.1 DUF861 domain-containing protein [Cupriavidus pauculus]MCM3605048.1 cupin domain-containing protein [Cupriavidus pauculus]UAK99506.1 cupin domain-containing protein [Cupriavidus pauculus]